MVKKNVVKVLNIIIRNFIVILYIGSLSIFKKQLLKTYFLSESF